MALGNYDNNKREYYTPVYYSGYGAGNADGVDPSSLSYSFYNRMLKLSISPLKSKNGDNVVYDHDNAAVVWITHTKARMLYDQIKKVLKGELNNGGVNTGKEGLVRFCDGKELGISNYCLVINKINENGEVLSSYAYEFKTHHHYAIENYDPKAATGKKAFYDNIEIDQLLDLLDTYYKAMTGAVAYSVMDAMRFTTQASTTKMDLIMSKLGVEYKQGMSSRTSGGGSSFFDSMNSPESDRSIRTATMDDLE